MDIKDHRVPPTCKGLTRDELEDRFSPEFLELLDGRTDATALCSVAYGSLGQAITALIEANMMPLTDTDTPIMRVVNRVQDAMQALEILEHDYLSTKA